MKKTLLIIGILLAAACVISLLISAFSLFGYHNVLDGSTELYTRLHRRAVIFGIAGAVLAVLTAACFIMRAKT